MDFHRLDPLLDDADPAAAESARKLGQAISLVIAYLDLPDR